MFARMLKKLPLTVAVGGIVTALLVMLAWRDVKLHEDRIFEFESWLIKEALSESVNSSDAVAKSMQALFHSSEHVDADQFRVFSKEIFSRYSFIRSAEYYPRVYFQERQEFEEEQQDWGFITFRIFEYNEKQNKKSAAKRDIYFPVIYKEPFSPEDAALIGYDILSTPYFHASILKAIETGVPVPSPPVEQKKGSSRTFKLFIALYEGKHLPETPEARRKKVNGLIALTIYPEAMFVMERLPRSLRFELRVLSSKTDARGLKLFQFAPEAPGYHTTTQILMLTSEHNIRISEQKFRLAISKPLYFQKINVWKIIFAFAAGLIFSMGFFFILRGRRNLRRELAERRRAQQELAKHRDHLEELVKKRTTELEKKTIDLEQANIRLQEIDRLKSGFLANMSHELRTPLNAIIGFSEILTDQTFGELNAKQSKYINNILVSGRHLLQLINDVLDLSKVEAGKMELEPSRVNIKGLLENSLIMIKEKAMKLGVKLDLQISQELIDLEISADERKLKQIMFNLLSNAAKFTPAGGEIHITAQSTINNKQSSIQISVADTGIGIKPEDQERVFGEFEQVDSTFARQQQGTGLGLALTRKLVELHGGDIWVESKGEGKGSTFTFVVPIKALEREGEISIEPEEPLPSRPDVDDSRPLILVVEDDLQASELISIYLSEAGYGVAHAFDGEQAIQMTRELRPYAIILDIVLPKKDGWEVLAELKSLSEVKDIPVVIVSTVDNRLFGLNLGAVEYFVKPVNKEQLIEAVRKIGAVTVLVVDDEPRTVELLTDMLQPEGFSVLQAYGGQQGIDLAIEKHPDLIILDLMMPEVNGFDVVEQLRAHPEAMEIPIMIYTSKDLTAEDRQRLNSHVQAIASKSVSGKEDLLQELEKLGKMKHGI